MQRRAVVGVILLGLLIAGPAFGAVRAVFVLDRSGSMSEVESGLRATGNSRCLDAWLMMKTDMADFFTAHPSGTAAVVYFSAYYGGVVNVTQTMFGTDFVGPAQATGALNSLDPNTTGDCAGASYNWTPLADAMCVAVNLFPSGGLIGDKHYYISSDGGENDSSGPCSGPSNPSTTPPFTDKTYWQGKVLNQLTADYPLPIMNVRFWEGPFPRPSGPGVDAVDSGPGSIAAASDWAYFEYLVDEIGGQFIVHRDDNPVPPDRLPAVSTWGLMIIALMLLVGAKVYFRQRHALHQG